MAATLATFFIGRSDEERAEVAGAKSVESLRAEVRALRGVGEWRSARLAPATTAARKARRSKIWPATVRVKMK